MTKISVEIREQDGVFYATSETMPGFLLVNKDVAALRGDILPAMKQLVAIILYERLEKVLATKPRR